MLHSVKRHPNQDELTESPLLNRLGYECERTEKLDDYLHENVCQGGCRRDPNINTKSAEEVLERLKHNDKSVVAGTDVFDRLRDIDVTEIFRLGRKREHTESRTPMPVNIAFAGGNGCRMTVRNKKARLLMSYVLLDR